MKPKGERRPGGRLDLSNIGWYSPLVKSCSRDANESLHRTALLPEICDVLNAVWVRDVFVLFHPAKAGIEPGKTQDAGEWADECGGESYVPRWRWGWGRSLGALSTASRTSSICRGVVTRRNARSILENERRFGVTGAEVTSGPCLSSVSMNHALGLRPRNRQSRPAVGGRFTPGPRAG